MIVPLVSPRGFNVNKAAATVADETEKFRQLVVAAQTTPSVGPQAEHCLERLNELYSQNPQNFTTENIRWLNVLRGYLAIRLAAHKPAVKAGNPVAKPKRKGDSLDHCWRCLTKVDDRFSAICPTCDSKEYHWRVCPVCAACGCQRGGKVLV